MKSVIQIALIFLFISCQEKQEHQYTKEENSQFTLAPTELISLPVDSSTTNQFDLIQYVGDENSGFIIVENKLKQELQYYSLAQKRKFKTLRLDSLLSLYGFTNMEGFYYHNKDSIFIFRKYSLDKILLVDESLQNNHLIETGYSGMANHTSRTRNPIIYRHGKLYALVIPYLDFSKKEIFNEKVDLEFVIDLQSKENYFLSVDYPERYQGNSWGISHSIPCRIVRDNGQIVYSFGIDQDVSVFDIESGSFYQEKSKLYTDYSISPMNINDPKGNQNIKYFIETDFFSEVFYDKYNKVFYRILKKAIPFKDQHGNAEIWENKPATVLILNEDFNQIGSYDLDPTINYYVRDMFVGKEGLYVSNVHPDNLNIVEDSIKFTLLKLVRND